MVDNPIQWFQFPNTQLPVPSVDNMPTPVVPTFGMPWTWVFDSPFGFNPQVTPVITQIPNTQVIPSVNLSTTPITPSISQNIQQVNQPQIDFTGFVPNFDNNLLNSQFWFQIWSSEPVFKQADFTNINTGTEKQRVDSLVNKYWAENIRDTLSWQPWFFGWVVAPILSEWVKALWDIFVWIPLNIAGYAWSDTAKQLADKYYDYTISDDTVNSLAAEYKKADIKKSNLEKEAKSLWVNLGKYFVDFNKQASDSLPIQDFIRFQTDKGLWSDEINRNTNSAIESIKWITGIYGTFKDNLWDIENTGKSWWQTKVVDEQVKSAYNQLSNNIIELQKIKLDNPDNFIDKIKQQWYKNLDDFLYKWVIDPTTWKEVTDLNKSLWSPEQWFKNTTSDTLAWQNINASRILPWIYASIQARAWEAVGGIATGIGKVWQWLFKVFGAWDKAALIPNDLSEIWLTGNKDISAFDKVASTLAEVTDIGSDVWASLLVNKIVPRKDVTGAKTAVDVIKQIPKLAVSELIQNQVFDAGNPTALLKSNIDAGNVGAILWLWLSLIWPWLDITKSQRAIRWAYWDFIQEQAQKVATIEAVENRVQDLVKSGLDETTARTNAANELEQGKITVNKVSIPIEKVNKEVDKIQDLWLERQDYYNDLLKRLESTDEWIKTKAQQEYNQLNQLDKQNYVRLYAVKKYLDNPNLNENEAKLIVRALSDVKNPAVTVKQLIEQLPLVQSPEQQDVFIKAIGELVDKWTVDNMLSPWGLSYTDWWYIDNYIAKDTWISAWKTYNQQQLVEWATKAKDDIQKRVFDLDWEWYKYFTKDIDWNYTLNEQGKNLFNVVDNRWTSVVKESAQKWLFYDGLQKAWMQIENIDRLSESKVFEKVKDTISRLVPCI